MREMNNYIYKVLFLIFFISSANAENKVLNIRNPEAKITEKVFSSLTRPHCANFHENIFEKLKKEYIDEGLVKFEHHAFPLDLAALNAEIIVRCHVDKNKNFQLLGEIYKKQKKWAVGSDIKIINNLIMKIGLDLGLDNDKMVKCLKNEKTQDLILNERIQAQQKYKIQSTPTIYIDKKKYNGEHKYKEFKKALNKILKKNEI